MKRGPRCAPKGGKNQQRLRELPSLSCYRHSRDMSSGFHYGEDWQLIPSVNLLTSDIWTPLPPLWAAGLDKDLILESLSPKAQSDFLHLNRCMRDAARKRLQLKAILMDWKRLGSGGGLNVSSALLQRLRTDHPQNSRSRDSNPDVHVMWLSQAGMLPVQYILGLETRFLSNNHRPNPMPYLNLHLKSKGQWFLWTLDI